MIMTRNPDLWQLSVALAASTLAEEQPPWTLILNPALGAFDRDIRPRHALATNRRSWFTTVLPP